MSRRTPSVGALYLPGVEADPKPGAYRALIDTAKSQNDEYSKIWDLFAFQQDFTIHLARFTQGVLRQPTTISPGLRELIAAYTSHQNECGFCTRAHAAAAAELLGDEALVSQVLQDLEQSPLEEKEKLLLRFTAKVTKNPSFLHAGDVTALQSASWDDEAIYYAITTYALFNFYNRWIAGTGVPEMTGQAHREQGRSLAARGYLRE
ncbi:MAG: peroxidase-related enzyme [Luteitalea sp.]|nr:peroxidase-related enzyme [Luteitalea sp.]